MRSWCSANDDLDCAIQLVDSGLEFRSSGPVARVQQDIHSKLRDCN